MQPPWRKPQSGSLLFDTRTPLRTAPPIFAEARHECCTMFASAPHRQTPSCSFLVTLVLIDPPSTARFHLSQPPWHAHLVRTSSPSQQLSSTHYDTNDTVPIIRTNGSTAAASGGAADNSRLVPSIVKEIDNANMILLASWYVNMLFLFQALPILY